MRAGEQDSWRRSSADLPRADDVSAGIFRGAWPLPEQTEQQRAWLVAASSALERIDQPPGVEEAQTRQFPDAAHGVYVLSARQQVFRSAPLNGNAAGCPGHDGCLSHSAPARGMRVKVCPARDSLDRGASPKLL